MRLTKAVWICCLVVSGLSMTMFAGVGLGSIAIEARSAVGFQAEGPAVPLGATDWRLIRLGDSDVGVSDPQRQAHLTFDKKTGKVTGSGGCNTVVGKYKVNGEHILFSDMASTMRACADGMDTEGKLLKGLPHASTWKISGRRLELRDDSGAVIAVFEAKD